MSGLDGSVLFGGSNATSISGSLTTTQAGDVIIVTVETNGACNNVSVSDAAGLTWTRRGNTGGATRGQVNFWAHASGVLSADTITVTEPSGQYLAAIAFAISGAAAPASPFDTNASLPATAASGAVSISTTAASTFAFGCYRGSSGISHGAGWTAIQTGTFILAECQTLSAVASGLSVAFTGTANGGIGDAIVLGGSPSTFAGTSATTTAATGALAGSGSIAGTATAATTTAGAFTGSGSITGASTAANANAGAFRGSGALAGTSATTTATAGALAGSGSIAGTSATSAVTTGSIAGSGSLGGASLAASAATGALRGFGPIAGVSTIATAATGAFAGSAPGSFGGASVTTTGATGSIVNLFLLGPLTTVPAETYITTIPAETYITTVPA